jgi:hypothetical protein
VLTGLLLCALAGEVALRVVYRDEGRRTLGGPGGRTFDHETTDGVHRGRLDTGPKIPGVPRVMVIGDSITYGLGVHDWRATWPEQLAQSLERRGRPHQFAVLALPGNDMPQHLDTMRGWISRVQPDVVIYQWYVNDIEAISHRPNVNQPWHRWPWHHTLQSWSYLYFVLDHRFSQLFSRPNYSYLEYLRRDFLPGTLEWTEFEREFHEFAVLAMRAPRRLMILFPQVPFRGPYPLQAVHDRMRWLAGPHDVEIPPVAWTRAAGVIAPQSHTRWGQAVQPQSGALQVQTGDYLLPAGPVGLKISVAGVPATGPFAMVSLVDVASNTVVASAALDGGSAQRDGELSLRLMLPGDRVRRLAVRVTATGAASWGLTNIAIPVNYGFEMLDLADRLNTFNTHASSFDAHPNERAHQVVAESVLDAMSAWTSETDDASHR